MGMRTSVRLRGAEAPSHEGEAQYAGRFSDNPHASTMKGAAHAAGPLRDLCVLCG